jgi:hypothetical protein
MDEQNEQSLSYNADNSLNSKETDATLSSVGSSFENQKQTSRNIKSHIIAAIAANLKDIIEENKKMYHNTPLRDNIFYLEQLPPISLENYIRHLVTYTNMNISSLILSVIYIDQYCEKYRYVLSMNNIYRLILIFVFISMKYNEDTIVNAKAYAQIAGVSVEDLKILEFRMCEALDFNFYVKSECYQQYYVYFCKFSS